MEFKDYISIINFLIDCYPNITPLHLAWKILHYIEYSSATDLIAKDYINEINKRLLDLENKDQVILSAFKTLGDLYD